MTMMVLMVMVMMVMRRRKNQGPGMQNCNSQLSSHPTPVFQTFYGRALIIQSSIKCY